MQLIAVFPAILRFEPIGVEKGESCRSCVGSLKVMHII